MCDIVRLKKCFTFNALIQQQLPYYVSYSYSQPYKIGSQNTIYYTLKILE